MIRVDVRNIPVIHLNKGLGLTVVEHKVRLFELLEYICNLLKKKSGMLSTL